MHTDIHTLSGIRTRDPTFRASEDTSYIRPHGHCDEQEWDFPSENIVYVYYIVNQDQFYSSLT
jgi:hypothetical protein